MPGTQHNAGEGLLVNSLPLTSTVRRAVRSEGGTMTEKKSAHLGSEEIKN
ncbi:MAG: hypothetical protein KAU38_17735 [Desulfobacterales bacterium]|nr:hypothetical protein [Desulfobacterales bacterium]